MKKLFSLSVAAMLSAAAFAQDTIPNRQNSNPNTRDTIPGSNRNWNDTSNRSRTMDSTYDRRNYPDSMNNDTSSFANRNQSSDSLQTNQNSNWNSTTRSDSMTTSSTTQSNTSGNNTNTNTTSSSNTPTSADSTMIVTDRVIMRDDTMYIIKNGQSANLAETFKLESGATVSTDGTVTYPSGKTVKLKNGQFIEITKATTTNDDDEMNATDKKTTKSEKSTKSKKSSKKSKTTKSSSE